MDILVLGGTRFIGPHFVETARSRGHRVDLFNRGETDPERFADLKQYRGDRDAGDYSALEDGQWDAVVDTSAYYPRAVREALDTLGASFDHYLFISTVSVYRDFGGDRLDEDSPLEDPDELDDPTTEEVGSDTYGPLKVMCEREARDRAPGRLTILRPGVIGGPGDHTDRLTYWPVRVADGGRVLAPSDPERAMQYIDVRDLAEWMVTVLEERIEGTYNTVVPRDHVTWRQLLETCRTLTGSDATFDWADQETLQEADVDAFSDLPLWAPADSSLQALAGTSSRRAREAGMDVRDVETTVRDIYDWYRDERGGGREGLRAGLSADEEAEVLELLV